MPTQTKPIKKADLHFWSGRLKTGAATGELYIYIYIRFRTFDPLIESGAATGELYIYIYMVSGPFRRPTGLSS